MIYTGSLIEIYTTMFGWSLYNAFYDLLALTGALYFPFLMALYHNWKKPYESQEGKAASVTSQRRMQVAIVSLILVFSMAVLPVIDMHINNINYHKACDDGGTTVVTHHTNGLEDNEYTGNVGNDLSSTRIPLYWWLVLTFSSGVNNAATSNLKCFGEIKELDQQLRNLTIKDQSLRQEYARFADECFFPAKARYQKGLRGDFGDDFTDYIHQQYDTIIGSNGYRNDPFYIGSELYLQSPGFYNWDNYTPENCNDTLFMCSFRASRSVPNWPYDEDRDRGHSDPDITNGVPGTPYCDQWWNSTEIGNDGQPLGLKTKLLNSTERSSTDVMGWDDDRGMIWNLRRILENAYARTFTDEELERLVISRYADGEPPRMLDENWRNFDEYVEAGAKGGGSAVGITWLASILGAETALPVAGLAAGSMALSMANALKDFYLTMFILKSAAPFAQAVILMMMYGLMIFYLVVSEYDIESILLMTFLILAVRFFTPLWDIADYLDANLYTAMYPNVTDQIATLATQGINRLILDMVQTVSYIVVPGIFFLVMSMAGLKLGKGVAGMDSISSPLGAVGKGVGNIRKR
jgi:hypothetical protein